MPCLEFHGRRRYDKIIDESAMKAIISAGTVTNHSNTASRIQFCPSF